MCRNDCHALYSVLGEFQLGWHLLGISQQETPNDKGRVLTAKVRAPGEEATKCRLLGGAREVPAFAQKIRLDQADY